MLKWNSRSGDAIAVNRQGNPTKSEIDGRPTVRFASADDYFRWYNLPIRYYEQPQLSLEIFAWIEEMPNPAAWIFGSGNPTNDCDRYL